MEHGRFVAALKALRRWREGPPPPPHALWRLGRWALEHARPRLARLPLRRFLELYPNHLDRPEVLLDLARALGAAGRGGTARDLVEEANRLGRERDARRKRAVARERTLSGRAG